MRASNLAHESEPTTDDGPVSESIVLDSDLPDGYKFLHPVHVEVWKEGDEFVAGAEALSIHAFGSNRSAAIDGLRREIVAHYRFLRGLGDQISPVAHEEARRFREWIAAPDG